MLFLFLDDRIEDIWTRLTFCEVHPALFLISHFLYNLLIILIVIVETLVFTAYFSGIDVRGSYFDIFLILSVLGIVGLVFGLSASVMCANENTTAYIITNVTLSCLAMGGRFKSNQTPISIS